MSLWWAMVLISPNATATCPLLEKFVLHEPKIFSKNGADCAPSTLEKNHPLVDCRCGDRFGPLWHRAIDRLARLVDGEFASRRHRVLTQPLALTLRRLPCLLHFRKIVTRVIGTAG